MESASAPQSTSSAQVRRRLEGQARGAMFTSTKCPPGPGLTNSCHLPFGLLWTPLSDLAAMGNELSDQSSSPESLSPGDGYSLVGGPYNQPAPGEEELQANTNLPAGVFCLTCLCYLNLYCPVDAVARKWTCALCGAQNPLPPGLCSLPTEPRQDEDGDDDADQSLSTTKTPNTTSSSLGWLLSSPWLEFRQEIVPTVPTLGSDGLPANVPVVDTCTVVVTMDENLSASEAAAVALTLKHLLPAMLTTTTGCYSSTESTPRRRLLIGLITYGRQVTLFHLGAASARRPRASSTGQAAREENSGTLISSDVLATHHGLTARLLLDRPYLLELQPATDSQSAQDMESALQVLMDSISVQFGITTWPSSWPPHLLDEDATEGRGDTSATAPSNRMEMLKQRKEARLRKQQQQQNQENVHHLQNQPPPHGASSKPPRSPWSVARELDQALTPPWRCTGEAVQCAMDLTSAAGPPMATSTGVEGTAAVPDDLSRTDLLVARTARVLLFSNGCPNMGEGSVVAHYVPDDEAAAHAEGVGPGEASLLKTCMVVDSVEMTKACQFYDVLARAAAESGVSVDVLLTGASELGLPAYQALVEPSGGYAITQDSFSTSHLYHNLHYLLMDTFVSGMYLDDADPTTRNWVDACVVDIRTPGFVNATHLVGPGELVSDPKGPLPNELAAFAQSASLAAQLKIPTNKLPSAEAMQTTLTRMNMGRCDPLSTFAVMLRLNDFFQKDAYAFFQCVVRFVDRDGKSMVTRVASHRLAVAKDIGAFIDSVDDEVVPVLLAKEAVYRSMYGKEMDDAIMEAVDTDVVDALAYDAQRDLDATIYSISGDYRLLALEKGTRSVDLTEEGGIKAAGSSIDFAFPTELTEALRRLYHLRRGPLLSPGPLQSIDDRVETRSLFLRLPLEDCLSMMAPSLWSSGSLTRAKETLSFESVPPETLALWDDCIIAADHCHNLFVWSGKATREERFNPIRQQLQHFLVERATHRFPMPVIHILAEGDSMSRRFTSLLAPSHGDPMEQQLAHFPALAQLSPEEVTNISSKFQFYNADADPSFRNWFWQVASPTRSGKREGVSLCD